MISNECITYYRVRSTRVPHVGPAKNYNTIIIKVPGSNWCLPIQGPSSDTGIISHLILVRLRQRHPLRLQIIMLVV